MENNRRLTGLEIPLELLRVFSVEKSKRPEITVFTAEDRKDTKKRGTTIEGEQLRTHYLNGLQSVELITGEEHQQSLFWLAEGWEVENPAAEIAEIEVLWGENGKEQRIGIGEKRLRKFINLIDPKSRPDETFISEQVKLEEFLFGAVRRNEILPQE